MKKLKLLLVICAVALLSGCYKFDAKMKITEDKKVNLEVIYGQTKMTAVEEETTEETLTTTAVEENTEATTNEETTEENKNIDDTENGDTDITTTGENDTETTTATIDCNALASQFGNGWSAEAYSDDKFEGCKFTKSYASIDDISGTKDVVVEFAKMGNGELDDTQLFKKSGDKYSAHFKFSMGDQTKDSKDMITDEIKKSFELKYTVELPFKNLSNNATKVENDGKTLIWELDPLANTDIKFSFNFTGKSGLPWLYIGIGAGALLVIIVICVIASKGKKCDGSNCNCEKKEEVVEPVVEETVEEVANEVVEEAAPIEETVETEEVQEETTEEVVEENTEDNQ